MSEEGYISVLANELAQDPKLFKELAAASPHDFVRDLRFRKQEMQKEGNRWKTCAHPLSSAFFMKKLWRSRFPISSVSSWRLGT